MGRPMRRLEARGTALGVTHGTACSMRTPHGADHLTAPGIMYDHDFSQQTTLAHRDTTLIWASPQAATPVNLSEQYQEFRCTLPPRADKETGEK